MKAVEVRAFGGPEVMRVVELPEPVVGTGDVLIETDAIGVNFHDLWARLGLPGLVTLPFVEGIEVTGRVVAGGGQFRVGERVIGLPLVGHGAYAQRVVVPAEYVYAIPDAMPIEAAASFGVNFLTAYAALHYTARLRRGERVLVHAAAGGVGTAAIQLAQHGGAEVLGTASLAKHGRLKAFGVSHVIDYHSGDWVAEVWSRTGGEGVDVILDPIGGEIARRSLELLRYAAAGPRRRHVLGIGGVSCGAAAEPRDRRHGVSHGSTAGDAALVDDTAAADVCGGKRCAVRRSHVPAIGGAGGTPVPARPSERGKGPAHTALSRQ